MRLLQALVSYCCCAFYLLLYFLSFYAINFNFLVLYEVLSWLAAASPCQLTELHPLRSSVVSVFSHFSPEIEDRIDRVRSD